VERGAGIAALASAAPRVEVLAAQRVLAEGVMELLLDAWSESSAAIVEHVDSLEPDPLGAVVIDADRADAAAAAAQAQARGATVIVLVRSQSTPLAAALHDAADAILLRDEADARALRLALAAGRVGMRLVPRAMPPPATGSRLGRAGGELGDQAGRALRLLAAGRRDAEIAQELELTEGAVRKLIQRAVKRSGARTRCEAVAAFVRAERAST
jgi:DNA-binding NarL/FixJ family response regulator